MGYLVIDERRGGGRLREYDTINCRHCQRLLDKPVGPGQARQIPRDFCANCGAAICAPCKYRMTTEGCRPFMAQIDAELRRQALRNALTGGGP